MHWLILRVNRPPRYFHSFSFHSFTVLMMKSTLSCSQRAVRRCTLHTQAINNKVKYNSHGYIKKNREKKLVIDGHRDETALVELRRCLAYHDAKSDAPHQEYYFHWNKRVWLVLDHKTRSVDKI